LDELALNVEEEGAADPAELEEELNRVDKGVCNCLPERLMIVGDVVDAALAEPAGEASETEGAALIEEVTPVEEAGDEVKVDDGDDEELEADVEDEETIDDQAVALVGVEFKKSFALTSLLDFSFSFCCSSFAFSFCFTSNCFSAYSNRP
jgi:hypothetical protein